MKKIIIGFLIFITGQNVFGQNGWVAQGIPHERDYYCTFFINSQTGWSGAESGLVQKTTNGGLNWNIQFIESLSDQKKITSLYFLDVQNGFAILDSTGRGKLYLTTNGGNSWSASYSSGYGLRDIIFVNMQTGYLCGVSVFMKTTNAGINWESEAVPNDNYNAISFLNINTGWAATDKNKLYKTTNAGGSWTQVNTSGFLYDVKDLKFLNESTGVVYGETSSPPAYYYTKTGITTDGGISWTYNSIAGRYSYGNFAFANENTGYLAVATEEIFKTTNAGFIWESFSLPVNTFITGISVINSTSMFAFGSNGVIAKSENGNTWSFLHNNGYVASYMTGIQFLNYNTGFAVGGASGAGYLYKTTNSGDNWSIYSLNVDGFGQARCIKFINENTGFITGYNAPDTNFFIKTTNAGINWSNADPEFKAKNVFFINSLTGYASGNILKKTTDGGISWNLEANVDAENIFYLGESNGWGFTNKTLPRQVYRLTGSGGANWTAISTINTNQINSIFFNNQLTGWISIYDGLMKTTNGGVNWNSSYSNVYNPNFQFINENTGWAGIISITGTPMIKTTNGGITWNYFTVDYPHVTNVKSMYFINEKTGWITADNVGILKTTNGGVGIFQTSSDIPESFQLFQNYPNPFNPSTKINYELKITNYVTLKVFDLLGKEVASLVNKKQNAGSYAVDFNSTEYNLPSGIYFYTLNAGEFKETRKMILVK